MPAPAADAAAAPPVRPESHVQVLPGERASFDCAKARAIDEQIICSNHNLAMLDRRMGEIYAAAKAALPKADKDALLQAQRLWLAGHDQACGISAQGAVPGDAAACFIKRYQARTAALQALLTRGSVIRELGGSEPWVEANSNELLSTCAEGEANFEPEDSKYATFLIDGRRYIFFSGQYTVVYVSHGGYVIETEDGEEQPENTARGGECTLVLAEKTPGAGDFAEAGYDTVGITGIAEFLTGGPKGNGADEKFASDLHAKFPGEITVVEKNGVSRRYTWDAATKRYVKSSK